MNLDLRIYSTFKIGGVAHKVFKLRTKDSIPEVCSYASYMNKPLVIIGEGSNSIFADTTDKYVLGLMQIKGIEISKEEDKSVYIKVLAGEMWDDVVKWSVEHDLSGLESLSGIPGTAGAAPVQNIGAYGNEISNTLVEVEVFNCETKEFEILKHADCQFSYRNSFFKQNKGKYIITSITLKLSILPASIPTYKDVEEFFISNPNPTTKEIRNAILHIRNSKIPNYKEIPNCGSFFENPVIDKKHLEQIQKDFPDMPFFELPNSMIKVFASWLIEHVNYKEAERGDIVFNDKNKLVLLNTGEATYEDLEFVISSITKKVFETFEITLQAEPDIFK